MNEAKPQRFLANVSQCAEYHQTFCITKNEDYPGEYMQQVLRTHLDQYDRFFGAENIPSVATSIERMDATITTKKIPHPSTFRPSSEAEDRESFRYNGQNYDMRISYSPPMQERERAEGEDDDDEIELCETMEKVIYPTLATSETGVDLFIFNTDDHKQGVHVSICQNVGKSCDDFVILRNNYRSECKQQKIYRELLSLSPQGNPIKERFEFPVSCSCVLRRMKLN